MIDPERPTTASTAGPTPSVSPTTHTKLPRVLNLLDAAAVIVGSMIGSGIFLKVGQVDKVLAPYGFLPIIGVWIFVGLISLCGALALAELGAMFPHAGGPYLYLHAAYGRLPAFLWGWTEFWIVRTGSVGALACATAIYMATVIDLTHYGQEIVAISIVAGLSLINALSTRWGANVQNLTVFAKVGFLGSLIFLPIVMGKAHVDHWSPAWTGQALDISWWKALSIALIAVFWPYDGWVNLGPVAEEVKDPERNIPRAMTLGIGLVIAIYVSVILSYHLVFPMDVISQTQTIAADVFQELFGGWGAKLAAIGVMCSTFGAVNSNMLTGPRIYLAIARDGLLHPSIHQVHDRYKSPLNAILVQAIWTTLLIIIFFAKSDDPKGAFDNLTDAVVFAGLIFYGLTVAAVYVLRRTHPQTGRPYRTWGYPITPALLLLTYVLVLANILAEMDFKTVGVLVFIGLGMIYYQRFRERPGHGAGVS